MEPNGHERYEDELAAYMLGALEPGDVAAFEAHLADCGHCQARERWLRTSLDVLPASVEQLEPPPALRDRLMETVRPEAGTVADVPTPRTAAPSRRGLRGRFGGFALRPATVAATLVLILAAGVAGYAIRGGGSGAETIPVQGTAAAPQASGKLVRDGDRAVLQVSKLPQKRGRVYEVWLVKKGQGRPVPSTLFQVGRNGGGSAGVPNGLNGAEQVLVSLEPAGGSNQPTTAPVLAAKV